MKQLPSCMYCLALTLFLITWWDISTYGQTETIKPLQFNAALYYPNAEKATVHGQPDRFSVFDAEIVLFPPNTLNLPFVDDFSDPEQFDQQFDPAEFVTDTVLVAGSCVEAFGVGRNTRRFMAEQSYRYAYNLATKQIDSFPLASMTIRILESIDCFNEDSILVTVWPEFYNNYTFDTLTGKALDSVFVGQNNPNYQDTVLKVAEVYYAVGAAGEKWMDNYAYINSNLPKDPPSVGVATMDGLNRFGLPYNESGIGTADVLTSKPIDLSGKSNNDSVFLSFFYQPTGLGDMPDQTDSLYLEFKDRKTAKWETVWSTGGFSSPTPAGNFKAVNIHVKEPVLLADPDYLYDAFQFRFRNVGSLSGSNDHWHIDYVQLDENRSSDDTLVEDKAILQAMPPILNEYSAMPWDHFDPATDLLDTVQIFMRNLEMNNASFDWSASAAIVGGASVFAGPLLTAAFTVANPVIPREVTPSQYLLPALNQSKVIIRSQFAMQPNVGNLLTSNDTVKGDQVFDNVLAYDDGTAERVYGLEGLGVKRFAYAFNIDQPDTLVGIQIHFGNSTENLSNFTYQLYVWDSIELNNVFGVDSVIHISNIKRPVYVDSLNGFATFLFDTMLIVRDRFYIGWAQTDPENIEIGFDVNSTRGKEHMFIFTQGTWKASQVIPGSPMIRAVVGPYDGFPTAISEPLPFVQSKQQALRIYPVPASDYIFLDLKGTVEDYIFEVYNAVGQRILTEIDADNRMSIAELAPGVYVVHAYHKTSRQSLSNRFIKVE